MLTNVFVFPIADNTGHSQYCEKNFLLVFIFRTVIGLPQAVFLIGAAFNITIKIVEPFIGETVLLIPSFLSLT